MYQSKQLSEWLTSRLVRDCQRQLISGITRISYQRYVRLRLFITAAISEAINYAKKVIYQSQLAETLISTLMLIRCSRSNLIKAAHCIPHFATNATSFPPRSPWLLLIFYNELPRTYSPKPEILKTGPPILIQFFTRALWSLLIDFQSAMRNERSEITEIKRRLSGFASAKTHYSLEHRRRECVSGRLNS